MTDPMPDDQRSAHAASTEWRTKLWLIVWLATFLGAAAAETALQRRGGLGYLGLPTAVLVGGVVGAQWARHRGSRWGGFAVAAGSVVASALLSWLVQRVVR